MILLILSIITCVISLIVYCETTLGLRRMASLNQVELSERNLPKISIIITACNEEDTITETLQRLEKQDYPNFEIICVNDRSIDATGRIIHTFANHTKHQIKAVHIKNLPLGWMGKNHAAYQGAHAATGEWLLFMDADVHLNSSTLQRAMNYIIQKKLDHLSVLAHYFCKGFFYNIVHLVHKGHGLVVPLKPWLAKSKRSKYSFNLGVFCLIRKSAYDGFGGHQSIANECIDDLKIGEQVKKFGYTQEVVHAQEDISITWYPTLQSMIKGLQKNVFSFFNYKLTPLLIAMFVWYILFVWPIFASFLTHGLVRYINIFNIVMMLFLYLEVARFFKIRKIYSLFYPIGLIIYPSIVIGSAFHFLKNKGIYWRDTFYSADMLKK